MLKHICTRTHTNTPQAPELQMVLYYMALGCLIRAERQMNLHVANYSAISVGLPCGSD